MGATIERKQGSEVVPTQRGVPAQEMVTNEKEKVGLHEMPDLSKEAPEVTYDQPKRSWLRYLAVGLTVGAVAVGGGLVISTVVTDTAPEVTNNYSLLREHLAQTPNGFPVITSSGQIVQSSAKLGMEHLAQAPVTTAAAVTVPGGALLPAAGESGSSAAESVKLEMEHLPQAPQSQPQSQPSTVDVPSGATLE